MTSSQNISTYDSLAAYLKVKCYNHQSAVLRHTNVVNK